MPKTFLTWPKLGTIHDIILDPREATVEPRWDHQVNLSTSAYHVLGSQILSAFLDEQERPGGTITMPKGQVPIMPLRLTVNFVIIGTKLTAVRQQDAICMPVTRGYALIRIYRHQIASNVDANWIDGSSRIEFLDQRHYWVWGTLAFSRWRNEELFCLLVYQNATGTAAAHAHGTGLNLALSLEEALPR